MTIPPALLADIQTFRLSLKAAGRKPKTIRTYSDAVQWLAGRIDRPTWTAVTKNDIRLHIAWLADQGYSAAYISVQFRSLQQFFKFISIENETVNVMASLTPPTVPAKLVPLVAESDLKKLLATCSTRSFNDTRDRAIILMFASSGARLAEIAGLRVSDIDLPLTSAIVTGKGSRQRIVRFSAECALALSRYLKLRASSRESALWIGQRGPVAANAIYLMLKRRGKRCGVAVHPHQFRHTFSHEWLLRGGGESDLMTLNGWSSPSMVSRYGASAAAERARLHYDKIMAG